MKKILYFVFITTFAFMFIACERNITPPEEEEELEDVIPEEDNNEKEEDVNNKEEIDYCKVEIKIKDDKYFYYHDIKIKYEGGSGSGEGTYFIPRGTTFHVSYMYYIWQTESWSKYEFNEDVKSSKHIVISFSNGARETNRY